MRTCLNIILSLTAAIAAHSATPGGLDYGMITPRIGDKLNVYPVTSDSWTSLDRDTVDVSQMKLLPPFKRSYLPHIGPDSIERVCSTERGTATVYDISPDSAVWVMSFGTPGSMSQIGRLPYVELTDSVIHSICGVDIRMGNRSSERQMRAVVTVPLRRSTLLTWDGDTVGCYRLDIRQTFTQDLGVDSVKTIELHRLTSRWFCPGYRYPLLESTTTREADSNRSYTECVYVAPEYQATELPYDEANAAIRANREYIRLLGGYQSPAQNWGNLNGLLSNIRTDGDPTSQAAGVGSVTGNTEAHVSIYGINGIVWSIERYNLADGEGQLLQVLSSLPRGEYIVTCDFEGRLHTVKISTLCLPQTIITHDTSSLR